MKRLAVLCIVMITAVGALFPVHYAAPYASYREVTTEHFMLIFKEEHRDIALPFVEFAEEEYARQSAFLRHSPITAYDRIALVFIDNNDDANGWASVYPLNLITLYITPPNNLFYNNINGWLKNVFMHELAHVLQMNMHYGVLNFFIRTPTGMAPAWFIEGYAEYQEGTIGLRGRTKDALIEHFIGHSIDRREKIDHGMAGTGTTPKFPYGYIHYYYGARFINFLEKEYGEECLSLLISNASHRIPLQFPPHVTGFERAFYETYGATASALWNDFQFKERAAYRTKMSNAQNDLLATPPLLDAKGFLYALEVSPSGEKLLLEGSADTGTYLEEIFLATGKKTRYAHRSARSSPIYVAEDQIAYLRYVQKGLQKNYYRPFLYDTKKKKERAIKTPKNKRIQMLAYDDDKGQLYGFYRTGNESELYRFNEKGEILLTRKLPLEWESAHRLSVKAGTAVFAVVDGHGTNSLVVYTIDEDVARVYTIGERRFFFPFYYPEKNAVYFASDFDDYIALYALDLHTRAVRQILSAPEPALIPSVARETDTLYVAALGAKGANVFAKKTDDLPKRPIVRTANVETRTLANVLPPAVCEPIGKRYTPQMHHYYLLDSVMFPFSYIRAGLGLIDHLSRHDVYAQIGVDFLSREGVPLGFKNLGLSSFDFGYQNSVFPVSFGARVALYKKQMYLYNDVFLPFYNSVIQGNASFAFSPCYSMHALLQIYASFYRNDSTNFSSQDQSEIFDIDVITTLSRIRTSLGGIGAESGFIFKGYLTRRDNIFATWNPYLVGTANLWLYFTPFWHFTIIPSISATVSSASTIFGGDYNDTIIGDISKDSYPYYWNSFSASLALRVPILRRQTTIITPAIVYRWSYIEAYGALSRYYSASLRDMAAPGSLNASLLLHTVFDLFYGLFPVKISLGVTYNAYFADPIAPVISASISTALPENRRNIIHEEDIPFMERERQKTNARAFAPGRY